jgi:hypothetical protein
MQKALTDTFVRALTAPDTGRTEVADLRCAGLEFRVTAAGVKSWSFRFRDPLSRKSSRATITNPESACVSFTAKLLPHGLLREQH